MEARFLGAAVLVAAMCSLGASYRTTNFVVQAATPEIAAQVGNAAEQFRHDLAIRWLGQPMRNWYQPCPITVKVADNLGAGGATSFVFDHGEVFGWTMNIQGSLERVLDSVLPHEVTHTVFATHFRQPLPRWADEGACTTVEADSERAKQQKMLISFLRGGRGIAFSQMFAMKEYPADVLPLYAQGHSLTTFLIDQGGRAKFLKFVSTGLTNEKWGDAIHAQYGYENLSKLQDAWLAWVREGSPLHEPNNDAVAGTMLTQNDTPAVVRGQSPDDATSVSSRTATGATPGSTAVASSGENAKWQPAAERRARPAPLAVAHQPDEPTPGPAAGPAVDDVANTKQGRDGRVLLEWKRDDNGPSTADLSSARPREPYVSVYEARVPTDKIVR